MQGNQDLNMSLRSQVIEQVLILEKQSKELLRIIFRIFEHKTKTLGNTSNAISLKTKIDFLRDLQDIDDEEYKAFIKLMEIRNQFAHNAEAVSFLSLDSINIELNQFLKKQHPKLFEENSDTEFLLKNAFLVSAKNCQNKLSKLIAQYGVGLQQEIKEKYTLKTIDDTIDLLKLSWKSISQKATKEERAMSEKELNKIGESLASNFENMLKTHSLEKGISNLDTNIKIVLNKKAPIEDIKKLK